MDRRGVLNSDQAPGEKCYAMSPGVASILLPPGMWSTVAWTVEPQVDMWLGRQTVVILAKSFDLSGFPIHGNRSRNRLRVLCEN